LIHEIAVIRQRLRPSPAERKPVSGAIFRNKDDTRDSREMEMTTDVGIAPDRDDLAAKPAKPATLIELVATAALALSTVVALTAVSIGIARADAFGSSSDPATAPLAVALFIGLVLSAMGGLTAIMADGGNGRR
jgi:hypothetical protein